MGKRGSGAVADRLNQPIEPVIGLTYQGFGINI